MKSRHSLLPIAVALAACLWTADAMAQPVTIPVTPSQESRRAAHDGVATHDTGERSGIAQPAVDAETDSAVALRQQALTAMELLREEIATLAALKHAQAALLAWNRGRTEWGEAPAFLAAALCADPAIDAWCALLPATFGNPHTEGGHDRD